MSLTYTKLFSSITASSIWSEDSDTKVVWVTLLAMADQYGRIHAAIPGLAKFAGVAIEATEKAIEKFLGPDKYSRTKDNEGRRIEEIDGGWKLLNHAMYRDLSHAEDRKEQVRNAQATFRKKQKSNQNVINSNQPSSEVSAAEAEAEADTDTKEEKRVSHTPEASACGSKEKPKAPQRVFTDLWMAKHLEIFGEKYIFQDVKDGTSAARLLKSSGLTPERLMEIAVKAWASKEWYCEHHSKTIATFASQFNSIRAEIGELNGVPKTPVNSWGGGPIRLTPNLPHPKK